MENTETCSDDKTHGESTPSLLICTICMKKFSQKTELKEHYRSVHKDYSSKKSVQKRIVRKFNRHLCNLCDKHFGDSWTLNHHSRTVHESAREHVCDTCGKAFLSNKDMVRHVKGVHLGEKITFPGGRGRKLVSLSSNDECKTDPSKLIPNILKNSKAERTVLIAPSLSTYNQTKEPKTVVEIVGIEKPKDFPEDPSETRDSLIDLSEGVEFLQEAMPEEHKVEEQPVFQLENLENLQLVLPEDSGEPRIIIPESGIKLTIQSDIGNSEKKVLHLFPDSSLPSAEESTSQDIQNIDLAPEANQTNLLQLFPGNLFHDKSEVKTNEVLPIDFPPKIVYKKVSDASSAQLMSVPDRKMDIIPVHHQQFKCEKCSKFFISKEFLDKHLHSVHPEIPSYNISIFNPNDEDIGDSQLANLEDIESIINFNTEDKGSKLFNTMSRAGTALM